IEAGGSFADAIRRTDVMIHAEGGSVVGAAAVDHERIGWKIVIAQIAGLINDIAAEDEVVGAAGIEAGGVCQIAVVIAIDGIARDVAMIEEVVAESPSARIDMIEPGLSPIKEVVLEMEVEGD